jgi:uracil-DNA glycosylase
VLGEGCMLNPPVMFVGEGPGAQEDAKGRPFVGPAGRLLDKMILAMGLTRESVYLTNVVGCFPGSTKVSAHGIERGYRRWYDGAVVDLVTRRHQLTGTPNHPVLTPEGWVPLQQLHKGSYVYRDIGYEDRISSVDPHVENRPTELQKVYETFAQSGVCDRVIDSQVNFHGDGGNGDVDVVSLQRKLLSDRHPQLTELICQILLEESYNLSSFSKAKSTFSHAFFRLFGGFFPAPACFVGGAHVPLPIFWSEFLHAQPHDFAARTQRHITLSKELVEPGLSNAKLPSQVLDSLSGEVALDEVLDVRFREYSGHVFNLQTSSGQYTADGIIVSNCRPPQNRQPEPEEIVACIPFLMGHITAIRPKVLVALGATAGRTLIRTRKGVADLRGKWHSFGQAQDGIPVRVTYHPAFLLRPEGAQCKSAAWRDLQEVMQRIGLKTEASSP